MSTEIFISCYLGMLFLQTVHIFEEIRMKAYKLVGSLEKYLKVASLLVFAGYLPLVLILLEVQIGHYLAFFSVLLAVGNGVIHLVGLDPIAVHWERGSSAGYRWGSWESLS